MSNISFNPFNLSATPNSGSLSIGTNIPLISFKRFNSTFLTASQMDVGSINLEYTSIDSGSSADIIFKVASPENYNSTASAVLKISATGSSNAPRIGIGDFNTGTIDSQLHVKGDTKIENGGLKFTADGEDDVEFTKANLKDILDGKPAAVSSTSKSGLTRTNTTNAIVSLADDNTLIKINEAGVLDFQVSGSTAIKLDKTGKGAPKVMITGSTEISGSTIVSGSFTVTDLLNVLADYNQTGSFSVSGSTTLAGDVNADGAVNVNDLLTVLGGFNASGSNYITGSVEISGSLYSRRTRLQQYATGSAALQVGGGFIAMGNPPPDEGDGDFDWPYNPDANGNGLIEVTDLMALLAVYGQEFNVAFEVNPDGILCDGDTHISGNLFHGYCEPCDETGHNTITGNFNHAHGYNNTITGDFSFARGKDNTVVGDYGFLMGQNLTTTTEYQTVVGKQNSTNANALFIVGKGSGTNALEVEADISTITTDLTVGGDEIKFTGIPSNPSLQIPLVIDGTGKISIGPEYATETGGGGTFEGFTASVDDATQVNISAGAIVSFVGGNNIVTSAPGGTQIQFDLDGGVLSGSAQIATEISGAFTLVSSSIASNIDTNTTNIDTNTTNITNLQTSASAGIRLEDADSGFSLSMFETASFSAAGGGLTVNVTANDIKYSLDGVLSSSQQIASEISGAIDTATGSAITDILYNYELLSGSIADDDDWHLITGGSAVTSSRNVQITASLVVGDGDIGTYSFAQGLNANAIGDYSHAQGSKTLASGVNSHAEGAGTAAQGNNSHAEGGATRAVGSGSHSEGWATISSGSNSHAEGYSNIAYGAYSHVEGYITTASADGSHAEGYKTSVEATALYGHAEGYDTIARGQGAHAEGSQTLALGDVSHAEGRQTSASGDYSHAQGRITEAYGNYSFAAGIATLASGAYSFAIGSNNESKGNYSFVAGATSLAKGLFSFAHGQNVTASGDYSHAEGGATLAEGSYSHAEGRLATASGNYSHAEGNNTVASGIYSHAEGSSSLASGTGAHVEGLHNTASGEFSHAQGGYNTASGDYSHAQGLRNVVLADWSFVGGYRNIVSASIGDGNEYCFAHGSDNIIFHDSKGSTVFGSNNTVGRDSAGAFILGSTNIVSGSVGSYAAGTFNLIRRGSNNYFHGNRNTGSFSVNSHAEGELNYILGGDIDNQVSYSHIEGYNNTIGNKIQAGYGNGSYSHAEGAFTEVYGQYAHTEGSRTIAYGTASHAEGNGAIAYGDYSHAQGDGTIASGSHSFSSGIGTIAGAAGSATFGHYNVKDTSEGSLLIIGNGTSGGSRNDLAAFNTASILLDPAALPTSDPSVNGQLWREDAGDGTWNLKISIV